MTNPDDALEADLHSLSDEEWREAHEKIVVPQVPEEEAKYLWAPGTDKSHLIGPDEKEVAPTDGK